MIPRREALMLGFALLASSGAALRIARTTAVEPGIAPFSFPLGKLRPFVTDDSLTEAAGSMVANDPFRLVNRPSSIRFDARTEGGGPGSPPPSPPYRPSMTVKAIVGGPPWQAIVDGLPGQPPGTIVRSGSTFDKLIVRNVGRDTVVIQAPDTVWKLTLMRGQQ
ncbi:MAG: hypothetical protein ABI625_22165 [bacterium]